jgi:hypothetical protein
MNDLTTRAWNGTPILRRTTDGYVNATTMCKANGKEWSKYRESDRCQTYLDALAETSEIRMFDLIESRQGQGGGTWVHPQVAVDLARWISAPFAVWMDGWFLEELSGGRVSQVRDTQPVLPDVLTTVERSLALLEKLGGVDDRSQLLLKDIVLNHAARAGGSEYLLPGTKMLSLQEALQELGGASPKEATKLANQHGKVVKQVYRDENGRPPKTHKQLVNGRNCDVCDYEFEWLQSHQKDLVELVESIRPELLK